MRMKMNLRGSCRCPSRPCLETRMVEDDGVWSRDAMGLSDGREQHDVP